MKVILAKKYGFCFGVKRAVDCALTLKGDVNSLGPLIHNPQFVTSLEKRGIKPVESIEQIETDKVMIRTHGVPKKIIEQLRAKNIEIIDLTCPFVRKVQDYAIDLEEKGYKVIIIGQKGHPEVKSIVSNLTHGLVIETLEQAKKLPGYQKMGVVAQTTQKLRRFKDISEELKKHTKEIKILNTICNATQDRQDAALNLAKEVDLMIVVGGHNSANTNQLKNLCSDVVNTKQVETEEEIKENWFIGKKLVGLTAGASTPEEIIRKVKKRIESIR